MSVKGDGVRSGLREVFESNDVAAMAREFFLGMLNEGVLLAPRGMGSVPTVAGEPELDQLMTAATKVARRLR